MPPWMLLGGCALLGIGSHSEMIHVEGGEADLFTQTSSPAVH